MLNETNELERAIDRKIASATGKRTRTTGTVSRIETDGTIYVLFDGSDSDTIISKSTASVKIGDRVSVRVENGRAAIEGNSSDPAASSTKLSDVSGIARTALADASRAQGAADAAEIDAQRAKGAADSAQQSANAAQQSANSASQAAQNAWNHADDAATAAQNAWNRAGDAATAASNAQQSADRANVYSNAALDQLGVVQDVAGILSWASEHGSFAKTSDTVIQDGKVYFVKDGNDYSPVVDPQVADLASYYELTVNEPMNDFIMAHLAVTNRGLWVLPAGKGSASDEQHAAGYKMLLASDGCYIYDGSGVLVRSDTASGTDFAEGRSFHFGSDDAYILYTPASGSTPASLVIGGANVQLGSSKTLSQWEADMQQAVNDAAAAVQTAQDVPIVTISSTNGTVFKRSAGVATTLVATIFTPGGRIDNATELRRRFGNGAYLQWSWRDIVTDAEHVLLSSDSRIGNGGFTLTVSPEDIDVQAVIACSLNY